MAIDTISTTSPAAGKGPAEASTSTSKTTAGAEPTKEQPAASEPAAETLSKEAQALAIVRKYVYGNAAASLIPVPLLDLVAITGVQISMIRSIAKLYNVPFRQEAAKEIVTSFLGTVGARTLGVSVGYSLFKLIPGVGTVLGVASVPLITGAFTHAVGKVFIMHFEAGGTLLDLNPTKTRDFFKASFDEAVETAKQQATA